MTRTSHQKGPLRIRRVELAARQADARRLPARRNPRPRYVAWLRRFGLLGRVGRRFGLFGLGRLGPGARPRLVELDAPLAVLGLLQRQAGAEALARAALEPGHGLLGATGLDQLARDRYRQLLARLRLPDHEAAARIVSRPAREALSVLDDVAAANRTGPEVGPRDPHVLEVPVELTDGLLHKSNDVAHERLARVGARLDQGQPPLPVAGQPRRGQNVLAEQADHVEALLGDHQRPAVALDVADLDQALDDRRSRGGRADPRLLHRLAQLLVVDELAGGLHRAE